MDETDYKRLRRRYIDAIDELAGIEHELCVRKAAPVFRKILVQQQNAMTGMLEVFSCEIHKGV